jgi:hypothetical protein
VQLHIAPSAFFVGTVSGDMYRWDTDPMTLDLDKTTAHAAGMCVAVMWSHVLTIGGRAARFNCGGGVTAWANSLNQSARHMANRNRRRVKVL